MSPDLTDHDRPSRSDRTWADSDSAEYVPALAQAHQAMPAAEAEDLARDHFGLEVRATRLATEKDDTFRLEAEAARPAGGTASPGAGLPGRQWILKVAHPAEPVAEISFQTALLAHVARADPAV